MGMIRGWHFTADRLRDGRPLPAIGEWLRHDGPIVPCKSGLHASERPSDALKYAPGPLLHRVELRGEIVSHGNPVDKHVGRERRIVQTIDATDLLRRFACDQALSVAHLWDMPDVVREYLTRPSAAASDAAWAAASDAARKASTAAAWDAARAAASAAARNAASAAACDAARNASTAAAWDAASDAALAAAWAAAWDDLDARVHAAFGISQGE